mgnify:CR=1 FL=1
MRKLLPYIITAVVAGAVAFAVSYFVSHSNIISRIVVSTQDGEKREWSKHYAGEKFLKGNPKTRLDSKWPRLWGQGPEGVENALVKLAIAKEKGLLSEEEYEKVMSVLIGPMQGMDEVEVDIDIKTKILEHDSDSEGHDSDNDDGD